jgi:hypothetical protein
VYNTRNHIIVCKTDIVFVVIGMYKLLYFRGVFRRVAISLALYGVAWVAVKRSEPLVDNTVRLHLWPTYERTNILAKSSLIFRLQSTETTGSTRGKQHHVIGDRNGSELDKSIRFPISSRFDAASQRRCKYWAGSV